MFRRILVTTWALIFSGVGFLGFYPRAMTALPRPRLLFIFLFGLAVISFVYGLLLVYREGMRSAKHK